MDEAYWAAMKVRVGPNPNPNPTLTSPTPTPTPTLTLTRITRRPETDSRPAARCPHSTAGLTLTPSLALTLTLTLTPTLTPTLTRYGRLPAAEKYTCPHLEGLAGASTVDGANMDGEGRVVGWEGLCTHVRNEVFYRMGF